MDWLAEWSASPDRALVMGILNVTPDSFYDGGRFTTATSAVDRALAMCREGADILDIGGESSRPGSDPVSAQIEMERVIPVIEAIHREIDVVLSVDTTKSAVAEEALAAGASVVNDISAMRFDEHMADVVAKHDAFVILMHMKGVPKTMQEAPAYEDPVAEVCTFLARRAAVAQSSGIARSRIFLDPGVGFGKRLSDNLSLIAGIRRIRKLGFPLVVGTSRKSFLKAILDLPADERLEGTIAANAVAIANGADIIRVHDVKEGRRTADVAFRLRNDRD